MVVTAPMGARGTYPAEFWCVPHDAKSLARYVPGVTQYAAGVRCTWEVAPIVARILKREPLTPPGHLTELPPGWDRYQQLFTDAPFDYQKEAARFLAARHYALLCDPMRVGKSLEFLMAETLTGSERTLVICPAVVKGVWAKEIAKWTKTSALVLEGLGCDTAHRFCLTCSGRGRMIETGARCLDCKARNGSTYGYTIFEVRSTEEPTKRMLDTYGAARWRCRRHPEFDSEPGNAVKCEICKVDFMAELRAARYVVVNYDLLTPRANRDARGQVFMKHNMRGWLDVIAALDFDLCGLDEAHYLRAFSTDSRKRGKMLSDRLEVALEKVPTVWGITGTPIYGHVRDLLPILNVISGGLYRGTDRRPWFKCFHIRYCDAVDGEWGWEAKGRSNEAELIERLGHLKIQRSRSQLGMELPSKMRRVEYIEAPGYKMRTRLNGSPKGSIMKLVTDVAKFKFETIVENVINEMAEGYKTYVLTYHKKTSEKLGRLIDKAMSKRANKVRMRQNNAQIWIAQNESSVSAAVRARMCEKYVAHSGAAVLISTIDSMPGGLSLEGALFVHHCDFHHSPSAIEQAEDRPNALTIAVGLTVTHYVVKGSIDEHFEAQLLPKFEHKDKLLDDENARDVLAAFGRSDEIETIDAVWDRHLAHLDDEEEDEDE